MRFFQEKLVLAYDRICHESYAGFIYCKQSACLKTLRLMSEYICPLRQTARDLLERYYLDNKDFWATPFDSSCDEPLNVLLLWSNTNLL